MNINDLKLVLVRYPVDYLLKDRRDFDSEDAACAEAGKQAAKSQS